MRANASRCGSEYLCTEIHLCAIFFTEKAMKTGVFHKKKDCFHSQKHALFGL